MSAESASRHAIFDFTLKNERGEVVLQTTLHFPRNQDPTIDTADKDIHIGYICDTSSSGGCLLSHASELDLFGPADSAGASTLGLYYSIYITRDRTLIFNIYRTSTEEMAVLD